MQILKGLAVAALLGALALSTWKMFEFRDRLHALTDNARWEATVTKDAGPPIMMFGDSQIALWPMAASFGALPIANRGISGDWATRAIERFGREFDALRPKTVVLLMGTNDLGNGQ